MIISHSHRFIFIKSRNTASTSVEKYFQKYCSDSDVIGKRGNFRDKIKPCWYNHMSTTEIYEKVSAGIWNTYFKFSCVRNPWERMLSCYEFEKIKFGYKEPFSLFLCERGYFWDNSRVYGFMGDLNLDDFVRFESLEYDIKRILQKLSLKALPNVPKEVEKRLSYVDSYNSTTKRLVERRHKKEISLFDYKFGE